MCAECQSSAARSQTGTGLSGAKLSGGQKPVPSARVARFVRTTQNAKLSEVVLAALFLCHPERSRGTPDLLRRKEGRLTHGTRSRAPPKSLKSFRTQISPRWIHRLDQFDFLCSRPILHLFFA